MPELIIYLLIFIYGCAVGSFLNVLIYRIPRKEEFIVTKSHCPNCGIQLAWHDLIPIVSYIILGGRCRKCKTPISLQYPIVEYMNGMAYVVLCLRFGIQYQTVLYCVLVSVLIAISLIDLKTYEIPIGFNVVILLLGVIQLVLDLQHWKLYLIGMVSVSGFILLLILVTKGRAMGGGDCILMAAAGLLIGWKLIIMAFLIGCILGAIIHPIRMKFAKVGNRLAFGPYLSAGILISIIFGEWILQTYMNLFL